MNYDLNDRVNIIKNNFFNKLKEKSEWTQKELKELYSLAISSATQEVIFSCPKHINRKAKLGIKHKRKALIKKEK